MSIHIWIIYFFCIYCLTIQNNDGSQKISGDALKDLYKSFVSEYPIVSIEDPFDQDDWEHYAKMTGEIGANVQIVGDDLLVTNPKVCRLHKTPPPSPPKNVFSLLGETGRIVLWLVAFCIVSTEGSEGNWFKSMQCSSAQGTLILLKNFFREKLSCIVINIHIVAWHTWNEQVNQIGSVTESIEAVRMSKKAGWGVMTSHRRFEACL